VAIKFDFPTRLDVRWPGTPARHAHASANHHSSPIGDEPQGVDTESKDRAAPPYAPPYMSFRTLTNLLDCLQ